MRFLLLKLKLEIFYFFHLLHIKMKSVALPHIFRKYICTVSIRTIQIAVTLHYKSRITIRTLGRYFFPSRVSKQGYSYEIPSGREIPPPVFFQWGGIPLQFYHFPTEIFFHVKIFSQSFFSSLSLLLFFFLSFFFISFPLSFFSHLGRRNRTL